MYVQGGTGACLKYCVLFNPQVKFWLDNESKGKKWYSVLSAKQLTPGTRHTKTSQHRRTKENFRKGIVWILGTCAYSRCLAYNLCLLYLFHLQYATVEKDGEKYMSYKNFVCDYLKFVDQETNSETINLIAKIADTTKDR